MSPTTYVRHANYEPLGLKSNLLSKAIPMKGSKMTYSKQHQQVNNTFATTTAMSKTSHLLNSAQQKPAVFRMPPHMADLDQVVLRDSSVEIAPKAPLEPQ